MEIVTNQQLQKATEKYLFNHREEIQEMINKKIATAVRKVSRKLLTDIVDQLTDRSKNWCKVELARLQLHLRSTLNSCD